jgi:DNA helicase-2/ATP-dependent DNA helicase PcrA
LEDLGKLSVGAKQQKSLHEFNQLIHKFRNSYKEQNAANITRDLLLDIDLQNYYENQNTPEALERWNNVEELLNSITEFQDNRAESGLLEFLEDVSLLTDIDRWNASDKAVTLMTVHSAKGLEFPVVMVAGLEEGLFPLGPQSYEVEELEEERRLFYVAVTRAMKKVYLSYAITRRRFGGAPIPTIQSRFISELPENMVEIRGGQQQPSFSESYTPKPSFQQTTSRSSNLHKGDHVAHKLFGNGRILDVEGEGESAKLTIIFSGNVRKKLIAKYANLTPLKSASF